MKCCLCILSILAVLIAVLYYFVSRLESDEHNTLDHLRPSIDKQYRLFKKDNNVQHVMRTIGVNPMNVHLGHAIPELVSLQVEQVHNDLWFILTQRYSLTEHTMRFKIGEEFQEICALNGEPVKSVITQYRNNLTHVQVREKVRHPIVIRRVFKPDELVVEMRAGNVVSTLVYFPLYEQNNKLGLT